MTTVERHIITWETGIMKQEPRPTDESDQGKDDDDKDSHHEVDISVEEQQNDRFLQWRLDTQAEFGVNLAVLKTKVACLYCDNNKPRYLRNFVRHGARCPGMLELEPKTKCQFCNKELPQSRTAYHSNICDQNPKSIVPVDVERKKAKLKCFKCGKPGFNSWHQLNYHLASGCSEVLFDCVKKCIMNYITKQVEKQSGKKTAKPVDKEKAKSASENNDNDSVSLTSRTSTSSLSSKTSESSGGQTKVNLSEKRRIPCSYCNKQVIIRNLTRHAPCCPGMLELEPKTKCQFCNMELPESKAAYHSNFCQENKDAVSFRDVNKKLAKLKCFKCGQTGFTNADHLSYHLGSVCCEVLLDCAKKCVLDNPKNQNDFQEQNNEEGEESGDDEPNDSVTESISKWRLDIQKSSGVELLSKTTKIPCIYCDNNQPMVLYKLFGHIAACPGIHKLEPKFKCQFCNEDWPESRAVYHTNFCVLNPDRVTAADVQKKKATLKCYKCGKTGFPRSASFNHHFGSECSDFLIGCAKECILSYVSDAKNEKPDESGKKCETSEAEDDQNHVEAFAKWRVDTQKAFGVELKSKKTRIPCGYCDTDQRPLLYHLIEHVSCCPGIQRLEPKVKCPFCSSEFPESKTIYHANFCEQNPNKVSLTDVHEKTAKLKCFKCDKSGLSNRNLKNHLAGGGCSTFLLECLKKSVMDYVKIKSGKVSSESCKNVPENEETDSDEDTFQMEASKSSEKKKGPSKDTSISDDAGNEDHFEKLIRESGLKEDQVTNIKCAFCKLTLPNKDMLVMHSLACKGVHTWEPTRKCAFCQKEQGESLSFIHEVVCEKNDNRVDSVTRITSTVKCPKCDLICNGGVSGLWKHLATTCLGFLVDATLESLQNHVGSIQRQLIRKRKKSSLPSAESRRVSKKRKIRVRLRSENSEPPAPEEDFVDHDDYSDKENAEPNSESEREQQSSKRRSSRLHAGQKLKECSVSLKKINPSEMKRKLTTVNDIVRNANKKRAEVVEVEKINEKEDQSGSSETPVNCPFCEMSFKSLADLKLHPVYCVNMKTYEPRASCRHCKAVHPVSLGGLHELICDENPNGIPLTKANIAKDIEIKCPNCKTISSMSAMPNHLSTCLDMLQSILNNALANSSFRWNQPPIEDFIYLSGLSCILN